MFAEIAGLPEVNRSVWQRFLSLSHTFFLFEALMHCNSEGTRLCLYWLAGSFIWDRYQGIRGI